MLKCSLKYLLFVGLLHGASLTQEFDSIINSFNNFVNKLENTSLMQNISPDCKLQMGEYITGLKLKKLWALKMFDAAAKPSSGILEGQIVELGSFDECLKIEKKNSFNKSIFGKYCLPTIPILITPNANAQLQQLQRNLEKVVGGRNTTLTETIVTAADTNIIINFKMATCIPNACSADDIQKIYYDKLGLRIALIDEFCQTKATQPKISGGAIATLSFFGLILWTIVASTIYDAVLVYLRKKPTHPMLIAFSVITNGKKLIATTNDPNQISCLHGIRVISTIWVILGHRYSIQALYPTKYYTYISEWLNDPGNMFILGATVSVDTFFLMAGMVISYLYMTSKKKFNVVLYYLHRYLRLTPAIAIVILIHVTLLEYMGSGPLWPFTIKSALTNSCEENWWKVLLYIQNYGNLGVCVPQSWYLAVDMQLFILSPILLFPMKKWSNLTMLGTGFLTIISILSCFLTAWFYELNGSFVGNDGPDQLRKYMKYYYLATWTRAGPWLLGIMLGYYVFKAKQKKPIVMNKVLVLCAWTASLIVLCTCVFAGHSLSSKPYNKIENSFYIALVRPSWSVAVGWVIFACVTGYGGPVNWFLSLPIFQVVSKFTYSLYLVHYTIIHITTVRMRMPPLLTNSRELYIFWGDFAFSFAAAVVLTLGFESPIITIEKCIFGPTEDKKIKRLCNDQNTRKSTEIA